MSDRDPMCESCGSNILGSPLHLCSIKTAKGWRREIPLHLRRQPFMLPTAKLGISDTRDWDLYEKWLEEHHEADALVADKRSGLIIQAIYDNPVGMHLSENLDAWTNIGRIQVGLQEEE